MDSLEFKLDRDIARSFLYAPTNSISYKPIHMSNNQNVFDNEQLGYSTNTNLNPMYYDVIIDTVTDYDIFYPIAKQTKKYYSNSNYDEHTISMNFIHDYDSIPNWSNLCENQSTPYEKLQPIKNVRFNDIPTWIPYSKNTSIPIDQYYFHPETIISTDTQPSSSSIRYIKTPFFWFRPVVDYNYAICIPTSRPSLHAYITSSHDSTPNPIRL